MPDAVKSLAQHYPKSWLIPAMILVSTGLLICGITLPVITLTELIFWTNTFSILTGIASLIQEGHHLLAVIIVFFSVIFPFLKLATLLLIWFARWPDKRRTSAIHLLGKLGKWSMLDVFVVALSIVISQISILAKAEPRVGIYVFGLSIAFSILATMRMEQITKRPLPE